MYLDIYIKTRYNKLPRDWRHVFLVTGLPQIGFLIDTFTTTVTTGAIFVTVFMDLLSIGGLPRGFEEQVNNRNTRIYHI